MSIHHDVIRGEAPLPEAPPAPTISVVIPIWREDASLGALISVLRDCAMVKEVIVSVAEAESDTLRLISQMGAKYVDAGAPGRGRQMDLGAASATGDWVLFQHADTTLTAAHLQSLAALTGDPTIVGGAFYRAFDERHPNLRWLAPIERWHNRSFGALFGDQSIFARREVFAALGGYRELPLMEDVDFSLRLRRHGAVALLGPPIASSPRKHLTYGPWRTTIQNALLLLLYHLGVPPSRLHSFYYRNTASIPRSPAHMHMLGDPRDKTLTSRSGGRLIN